MVKKDHRTVEQLFKRFERAARSEKDGEMRRCAREIVKELSVHAAIEEQILYPALRRAQPKGEDDVLEALEEHHLVKLTLAELDKMGPKDERFEAKVTVLMENVRHHVKEEEQELLPRIQKALDARARKELGDLMAKAKKAAPTRPHPGAPDTPPGNIFSGAVAALYDRSRDMIRAATSRRNDAQPTVH